MVLAFRDGRTETPLVDAVEQLRLPLVTVDLEFAIRPNMLLVVVDHGREGRVSLAATIPEQTSTSMREP